MRAQGLEARLAVAALLTVLHGCTSATAPIHALRAARLRWSERAPASYSITVTRSCECLVTGPVIVTARDGAIESRRYEATGETVPAEYADLFPAVEGLFDVVVGARRDGVARPDVTYDRQYGYPARIAIDFHPAHVDDEITYLARDLQRR